MYAHIYAEKPILTQFRLNDVVQFRNGGKSILVYVIINMYDAQ